MIKLISDINSLKDGFIYSAVWKNHSRNGSKVECYRIIKVDIDCDLVRTDAGNRTFSKLRWFNEQSGNVEFKD